MNQGTTIGKKMIDILSKTDYPVDNLTAHSFDWISDIPGSQDFLNWIICTITDQNYASQEGLILLKHMKKCNNHRTEEELDKELSIYYDSTTQCLSRSDKNNSDLMVGNELASKQLGNHISFSKNTALEEESILRDQIKAMKIQKQKIEDCIKGEQRVFNALVRQSSDEVAEVEKKFAMLQNNISGVHGSGIYFYQQPLEDYLILNETFENLLEPVKSQFGMGNFSKSSFNQSSRNTSMLNQVMKSTVRNSENCDYLNRHIQRAAVGIQEAEMDYIIATSEYTGVFKALELLDDLKNKLAENRITLSYDELRVIFPRFKPPERCSRKKLQSMCQTYARNMLIGKGSEEKTRKKERKMKQLTSLIELEKIVINRKPLNNVFWMFLHQEAKLITSADKLLMKSRDILNQLETENQNQMDIISEKVKVENLFSFKKIPILKTLGFMLLDRMPSKSVVYYEDIIEQLKKLDRGIFKTQHAISLIHKQQTEVMRSVMHSLKCFEDYLFTAPTRRLVLFEGDTTERINVLRNKLKEIEANVANLRKKYNKQKELTKNPYRKIIHYMWMYYLLQPNRLLADLIKIENESDSIVKENEVKIQQLRILDLN